MGYCPVICGARGGPIAVFNITDFRTAYPNFTGVPDGTVSAQFDIAGLYLRNDGTSPIRTQQIQTTLMYMLTAHLLQAAFGPNGAGAVPGNPGGPSLVGRVSSASEGSVSVSTDFPANPNASWFLQTPFGANFWQATAAYRRGKYLQGPTRFGTGIGNGGFFRGPGFTGRSR